MKKLLIVLFVLGISTQLFANISAKQLVGKWKYTVETDGGNMTGSLKFVKKEGELTGEVIADDGGMFPITKIEIKEGNILYFELKPEYDVIKVTLKIEGKKFKGSGSTYEGDFTITGEKTE
ncbi:MAG: hypothetical protein GQ525_08220 [Draconibacterium sp.]|nr:hypothetical protein [Draconibacterium sp.]